MGRDPKYGEVTTKKGSIPRDEPVFVLRAQDRAALPTLRHYENECRVLGAGEDHYSAITNVIEKFQKFADDNPDKIKTPDS